MHQRRTSIAAVMLLSTVVSAAGTLRAAEPPASRPIRGLLISAGMATSQAFMEWKREGGNAVVVVLEESLPRQRWLELSESAGRAGLDLFAWIEVARNPALADAHPEWMASPGGHHDDWRRRFPDAPRPRAGEVVKVWPWVPIGYAPAFEAHRRRLSTLLGGLPGVWAGAFLADLQCGPSSCGCGNDQCRWALDYGAPSTAPLTPGEETAARLVSDVQGRHPGKQVIPVWVTECETVDLPGAAGGTGLCGTVACARGTCWPSYRRAWNPLLKATPGPVAVALWAENFRRDQSWLSTGLSLFLRPPQGEALPGERAIAVFSAPGQPRESLSALTNRLKLARGGWVVARTSVDQSWEPRLVKVPR